MADKGFPCNWTSRLLCALPKMDSEIAVQDSTLCSEGPSGSVERKFSTSNAEETKAKQKKQTRGKKKKKKTKKPRRNQNQEERSDKGANKETARKTGKHFQNQWDWGWKESRSEETLGCRRCMWLWGKKTGIVSWWWEHHTVQAETETYLGGGGEAGDKCCLETGKED